MADAALLCNKIPNDVHKAKLQKKKTMLVEKYNNKQLKDILQI